MEPCLGSRETENLGDTFTMSENIALEIISI